MRNNLLHFKDELEYQDALYSTKDTLELGGYKPVGAEKSSTFMTINPNKFNQTWPGNLSKTDFSQDFRFDFQLKPEAEFERNQKDNSTFNLSQYSGNNTNFTLY